MIHRLLISVHKDMFVKTANTCCWAVLLGKTFIQKCFVERQWGSSYVGFSVNETWPENDTIFIKMR